MTAAGRRLGSARARLPGGLGSLLPASVRRLDGLRGLALLGTLALIGAFGAVLYHVADVAGTPDALLFVVAASMLGATLLARVLRESTALVLGAGLLILGLGWYLLSLSYLPRPGPIFESNVALLTGQSLNQIRQSGVWVLGVAPTPVFVTWYLALRRYYGPAALIGGGMLGYLVMTGDATWPTTLLGVVGAAGMLGFGDLDRRGETAAGAEHVAIVLAIMVAVPLVVSVAPAGVGDSLGVGGGGGGGTTTVETALMADSAEVELGGTLNLSPEVRLSVESPVERYWKATAYDRYTGDGWVRTGGTTALDEAQLGFPPGPRRTVRQTVEVESRLTSLPAAWRPVAVDGSVTDSVRVTDTGGLLAPEGLEPGDRYAVTSAVATDLNPDRWTAGDDYPPEIRERYTRLPDSTPDRVATRTASITEGADSPYTVALRIEEWLEDNREYSLEVDRPDGDVADAFLFDMEAGYCTYFATTMVAMLRSEDIPARLATGYAPGQQVGEDQWVVRGLDAHAWVEVYVEDAGWVAFDPTPSGPRRAAELDRIETARANNDTDVDTAESQGESLEEPDAPSENSETDPVTPEPAPNDSVITGPLGPNISNPDLGTGTDGASDGSPLPDLPPREHIALGLIVLAGAVAGVRQSGAGRWLVRTATVAWQPRADPATDVERAYRRVTICMERRHRPRRPGETVRDYLAAIDAPAAAHRVAAIRERLRYGNGVDADLADEAVALADDLRGGGDAGDRALRGPDW